ncbi:terminase large subunit domain-containing protein [Sphingobium aquiterrae]|uniref:terminase large subunit domain-containing protein n=1 Tax=Sphingobium aquiterrae TaxID=2038656 RepID=UPI0030191A6A
MTTSAIDDLKVLLKYQASAIALSAEHMLLVIEKSRRTGITYGFAADAVLTAAPAVRPENVYYIAYNLDMTREFIGYCADFAKAFDEVASDASEFLFDDGSEKGVKALRIDFPSGKAIIALSSKPRSLRGMQGKVLIDEAAFHDALDELLKAAMALTMWGSHVVVISTHDGADNPFNELVEDIRAGKKEGHVMRLTLVDALADGLYKRICLRTGVEWTPEGERAWEASLRKRYGTAAEEELDVVPSMGSGTYLSRAVIKQAMSADLPVIRLTCPAGFELKSDEFRQDFVREFLEEEVRPWIREFAPNRRSFFGQDFARTGDVSPIAVGQHDDNTRLICRFILEMRNVPFREQEFVLNWLIARMPNFCAGKMDARGNGSSLAEFAQQRWGFDRIEAVQASDKTYLAFMPKLKAGIEDRTLIIPADEGTLEDLRMVKLVKGVPKIPDRSVMSKADGAKGQRHGDNAIALMHLVSAADEDFGPMEVHTTGITRITAPEMTIRNIGFGTVGRAHQGIGF